MAESGFSRARLEAFSDGVIAVIITIMVLDLKAPADDRLASLLSAHGVDQDGGEGHASAA